MEKENTLPKNILVRAKNISMYFKKAEFKVDTLKETFIRFLTRKRAKIRSRKILDNISFTIKRGESLGVIGLNGSGKSTLLKIVAGIYEPASGTLETQGNIMLLNLNAGFDMEADAVENIFLTGALLGFTRKEMESKFKSILEFSELGEYIKMPLKSYSSGMLSRLGFAISMDICPDLLLVDEVLSVGDVGFQKKCANKIAELKQKGVSFMFVSHSTNQILELCEKTLWIENSQVKGYGPSEKICKRYLDYCAKKN